MSPLLDTILVQLFKRLRSFQEAGSNLTQQPVLEILLSSNIRVTKITHSLKLARMRDFTIRNAPIVETQTQTRFGRPLLLTENIVWLG